MYQQALANIVRHAQAQQVLVRFHVQDGYVLPEIQDSGLGFEVPGNWIDFARQGHLGLIGAVERAEAAGGNLTIHSAPGKGTQIQARVPLTSKVENIG